MEKRYCVYKHVAPEPDGRIYIGKTCQSLMQRWRQGYSGNIVFQHAIEEFGNVADSFAHYILEPNGNEWILWDRGMTREQTHHFSSDNASELEACWIAIYNSLDFRCGFNRQSGGDQGFVMSQDYIKYVSEMRKGWYQGEKNPFYGKTHTSEVKKAISERAKLRTGEKNPFKGKCHTEEAKERNRLAHLGLYDGEKNPFYGQRHSSEIKALLSEQHSKPISMYSLDGHFLCTFPSAIVAAKEMGVSVQSISMCATKHTKTSCGAIWRYFECEQLPETELPAKHALSKTIAQYTLQGKFIRTFESLNEAAQVAGTTSTNISQCVKGKYKQAGGYVWRDFVCNDLPMNELPVRNNRCRTVMQYDLQGNYIRTYSSLKEAAEALGVTPEAICHAVRGKVKSCAGYVFKYNAKD